MRTADLFPILLTASLTFSAFAEPMKIEVKRLPESVSVTTKFLNSDYIVASPATSEATEKTPLLIFLHGSSERSFDLTKLKSAPPIKYFNQQNEHPFVIIVPQCAPNDVGGKDEWQADDLEALFMHLKNEQPFDLSRVYLIGYSMGGYGTWLWGASHPERFAALAPHDGGLGVGWRKAVSPDLANWAKRLASLPIWIFHGDKDDVVPVERSQRMNRLLDAAGAKDVRLTMLVGKGHSIADNMRSRELYDWLLSHHRENENTTVSQSSPK